MKGLSNPIITTLKNGNIVYKANVDRGLKRVMHVVKPNGDIVSARISAVHPKFSCVTVIDRNGHGTIYGWMSTNHKSDNLPKEATQYLRDFTIPEEINAIKALAAEQAYPKIAV